MNTGQTGAWDWFIERDVGPSAGYLGCLGLWCAALPRTKSRVAVLAVVGVVFATTQLPGPVGISVEAKASADLAHLIAVPAGWWIGRWARRRG